MASKMVTDKHFGEMLRERRRAKGWTQPQLAERLKMHSTVLAKIEKGTRSVRMDEAVTIADLFGVSLDSLLGRRSGAASEVANIVVSLQHAAGRAQKDVGAIAGTIMGWFMELGGDCGGSQYRGWYTELDSKVDFEGYEELQAACTKALAAMKEAQEELFRISQIEVPKQVFVSRIDEMVEQRAAEKIAEMLKRVDREGGGQ